MDPYTITIQGFGTPAEAATIYEAITALVSDQGVAARLSLNIKRESDKAAQMRYMHRMEQLAR